MLTLVSNAASILIYRLISIVTADEKGQELSHNIHRRIGNDQVEPVTELALENLFHEH